MSREMKSLKLNIDLKILTARFVWWLESYQRWKHHIEPSVWVTYNPYQIHYHAGKGRAITFDIGHTPTFIPVIKRMEYPFKQEDYAQELLSAIEAMLKEVIV